MDCLEAQKKHDNEEIGIHIVGEEGSAGAGYYDIRIEGEMCRVYRDNTHHIQDVTTRIRLATVKDEYDNGLWNIGESAARGQEYTSNRDTWKEHDEVNASEKGNGKNGRQKTGRCAQGSKKESELAVAVRKFTGKRRT